MKTSIRYKMAKGLRAMGVGLDISKCPELQVMKEEISNLPGGVLDFTISIDANGDWFAESKDFSGLMTGGFKGDDINLMIEDATLTYFGIPAKYCTGSLLQPLNAPATIQRSAALAAVGA